MSIYNGRIQPTTLILSSKRNTTSSKGDIIKSLTPLNGTIERIRKGSITSYLIPKKGTITRIRTGINTKDFHVVLFKRIPRERVLNKYYNKNLKL
ncbi:hypothetical protein [Clostridium botulinum]|uniref:hypothetical protein n=1 Tax=Clostridium botulinum TaxID=1491 RepID=UPI0004D4648B|nr:hypothetical protein [Clostridium botulinum]KEH99973.1 hypothetical protein Z952_14730 [Clostridium botulinum C/D str. BKT75002]KEI05695.1 hypothetical protein Z954_14910 [Clostridium botulinum C/D str. BKT2873]MCD3351769.1 hypothetical protein [Clostridium botulinum D/C]MCD3360695.1 hypothetical protein [Clostridium botulinum D/C]MCD3362121.1 hypothetical protein [Clostridium botulinum D/C]